MVTIISAPLWDSIIRPFCWELSAAIRRHRFSETQRPLMGDFNAGVGISYPLFEKSRFSFFTDVSVSFSSEFNQAIGMAGGGRMALTHNLTDSTQTGLYFQVMQYFQGITQTTYQYGGKQRFTVGKNQAIIVDLAEVKEFSAPYSTATLSWQYHF